MTAAEHATDLDLDLKDLPPLAAADAEIFEGAAEDLSVYLLLLLSPTSY